MQKGNTRTLSAKTGTRYCHYPSLNKPDGTWAVILKRPIPIKGCIVIEPLTGG
jgi:hypothetical protein